MGDPDEPRDPDWDDVPVAAQALDGQRVVLITEDGVEPLGTFLVVPGLYGDARRARDQGDDES